MILDLDNLLLRPPLRVQSFTLLMMVHRVVVAACSAVLTCSISQEIQTVWLVWSLRQELKHHRGGGLVLTNIIEDYVLRFVGPWDEDCIGPHNRSSLNGRLGRVMKLASLAKLACSMLHVVLANGLVHSNWEQGL
jgi:hypothetical protein